MASTLEFWTKIENELRTSIPHYVKFSFELQGLNSPSLFLELTDESFTQIQDFIRSKVYSNQIPTGSDLKLYYGSYAPCEFEFSEEDKSLFERIKILINTKNPDFWKTSESNVQTANSSDANQAKTWTTSTLLRMLKFSFDSNINKRPGGFRFANLLKLIFAFIFLIGGRLLYDFLHANLPIPSSSTICRFIYKEVIPVTEGKLRDVELDKFLDKRKLPKYVWISEDATSISGKVKYDSLSNQLIGFVLPLDANSMPRSNQFPATTAEVIKIHFENNIKSSSLYVYMAQPVEKDATSFCLNIFGTDNTMKTEDVLKRWKFITNKLEAKGISVLGFSGDGDPRILKAMRIAMKLSGAKDEPEKSSHDSKYDFPGFRAAYLPKQICLQDTVHLGNKLKNRLFKLSLILPMGQYSATSGDIVKLAAITTKDKHFLNYQDLTLKDRMSFASTMRLCHPRIWALLKNKVPGSDGTQIYLKIIFFAMQSVLSTKLNPLERLYCIWYGVFFMRMWRCWLSKQEEYYSQVNNFISLNSYICLELNSHGMLNLIMKCLEENSFTRFLPWMFSSQACESFFRNLRSMSTTQSTVVNCNVSEAIRRLQKVQLLSDTNSSNFEAEGELIHFPRTRFLNSQNERQDKIYSEIPKFKDPVTIKTIKEVLSKAKKNAWADIKRLGMNEHISSAENIQTEFKSTTEDNTCDSIDEEDSRTFDVLDEDETDSEDEDIQFLTNPKLDLPESDKKTKDVNETSAETFVMNSSGKLKLVKKTSLCWFYDNNNVKLSSDRNSRVRESADREPYKVRDQEITGASKLNEIYIQDYCLFQSDDSNYCLIGAINGFGHMEKKTWTEIAYRKNHVNLEKYNNSKDKNVVKIGVYARWFNVKPDGSLVLHPIKCHGYIDIEQYRLTIPTPLDSEDNFVIPQEILKIIKPLMLPLPTKKSKN